MRLLPILALLVGCAGRARLDPKTPHLVQRTPQSVLLEEGLTTTMEVTAPPDAKRLPTVVLVHGPGPSDRDGTLVHVLDGPTPMFRILADELSSRGFTVVRYDQRHVQGHKKHDLPAYIQDLDQHTFLADLKAVVRKVRSDTRVDTERVYLLGYDEGAQVAMAAAVDDPSIAGVVMIGAAATPFRDRFTTTFTDLTLPYLERFAYQGKLDGGLLARAVHTAATPLVVTQTGMLGVSFTRNSTVVQPSPLVDRDRDGILSLDDEVEPAVPVLVDFAFGPLGPYQHLTVERALPTAFDNLEGYDRPLLALYGANDAQTPSTHADAFAARMGGHPRQDVVILPGLGHALGLAAVPLDDVPRPIAAPAREALVRWLVATVSRRP